MMADVNIEKVRTLLRHRGRSDVAELLQYSISRIDESSTYGSYLFSTLSTFEIYSPIENHERLSSLNENDRKAILDSILEIFPPRAYSPEITGIRFYLDLDLKVEDQIIPSKGLKEVGFEYIREQINKCEQKIMKRDYDGAITNARSLVESVCLYILDECKTSCEYDGNLLKLYKETYKVLKMDPSVYPEESIKQILSGIVSIINGLSNVRNVMGDAHGRSKTKYYKPTDRHAILAVNSAKVISEFLYASWKSKT